MQSELGLLDIVFGREINLLFLQIGAQYLMKVSEYSLILGNCYYSFQQCVLELASAEFFGCVARIKKLNYVLHEN